MKGFFVGATVGAGAFLIASLGSVASWAGTIGPTGCTNMSCFGVQYELDNVGNQDGGSSANDIWRIKLTADTTSYTGNTTDWISGVSIKLFDSGSDITGVVLNSTNAPGTWTPNEGKVNPSCATSPANGGVCAETTSQATLADGSTIWEWIFDITTTDGTPFTATPSIQVQYLGINPMNQMVQNQGITSEEITLDPTTTETVPVPEPGTLALFGLGLAGLGSLRRRRAA